MKKLLFWFTLILLVLENFGLGFFNLPLKAQAAAPAAHLVISEVQIAGATTTDEFIELYNPTNKTIDLENLPSTYLRVHIVNSVGTDQKKTLTPISGKPKTIQSFGFFLIAAANSDFAASADATYSVSSGNTLVSKGAVYISTSDTNGVEIIDKVGWGNQIHTFEASPFPQDPPANQSIERKPGATFATQGNGIDTNNNANDFDLRDASEPQNSASTPEDPNKPPTNLTVVDVANDDGNSLQISWDFSTSDFVTGYKIYRRTSPTHFDAPIGVVAADIKVFIDSAALTGTEYIYQIEALDGAYSSFSAESLPVASKDNLAPRITNVSPVDGSLLNTIPMISAVFIENGVFDLNNSSLSVDGVPVPAAQANFTAAGFSYKPFVLTEGQHQIQIKVADAAGNNSQLNTQFTYDTTLPTGALTINQGAQFTNTTTVALAITASDTSGVIQMALSNDGIFDTEIFEPFAATKTWVLSPNDGLKTVYIQFKDTAGNLSTIYPATIILDTTPPPFPTLTQSPLNQTIEPGTPLVFEGTAEPLSQVVIVVDSPTIIGRSTADINGFWRITLETTSLGEGKHNVKIAVTDTLGNHTELFFLGQFTIKKKEEKSVEQTPTVTPAPTALEVIPIGGVPPVFAAKETPMEEVAPAPQKIAPPTEVAPEPLVEQGKIKPEETKRPTDYTRLIITLAILIVAAGAAVGGYYGYEWWLKRGPKPPQGPPSSPTNQTRW